MQTACPALHACTQLLSLHLPPPFLPPLHSTRPTFSQHSCICCCPADLRTRALGPLLDWAAAVVPARQHTRAPVFLLGTAGLRRLPDEQQQELLSTAGDVLAASPFRWPLF